jgi:hypothetical protein
MNAKPKPRAKIIPLKPVSKEKAERIDEQVKKITAPVVGCRYLPGQSVRITRPRIRGEVEEVRLTRGRLEPLYTISWWDGDINRAIEVSESELED